MKRKKNCNAKKTVSIFMEPFTKQQRSETSIILSVDMAAEEAS